MLSNAPEAVPVSDRRICPTVHLGTLFLLNCSLKLKKALLFSDSSSAFTSAFSHSAATFSLRNRVGEVLSFSNQVPVSAGDRVV